MYDMVYVTRMGKRKARKRGPRPWPRAKRRCTLLSIRLRPDERQRLEAKAAEQGLTLSDLVRRLLELED